MSSDLGTDAGAAVVVTVHEASLRDAVVLGMRRAGRGASAAVVVCPDVARAVAVLAEALGRRARGLPVLGLRPGDDGTPRVMPATLALLSKRALRDLHVAVPAFEDDTTRGIVWDQLRARRIEERHQLVEVDARAIADPADLAVLGAVAAGILAGRMAAANRGWDPLKA
jgi:hypothetical protein